MLPSQTRFNHIYFSFPMYRKPEGPGGKVVASLEDKAKYTKYGHLISRLAVTGGSPSTDGGTQSVWFPYSSRI